MSPSTGNRDMYEDYYRWPHQFNLDGKKAKMIYRPTSFTALRLVYNKGNQNIALMLFINGHITISGLKNSDDSHLFAQQLYTQILLNYIRPLLSQSFIINKLYYRDKFSKNNTKENFGVLYGATYGKLSAGTNSGKYDK